MLVENLLGGGTGGGFELFLVGWDLETLDAFGVVVFLSGIRLVDFLDVCTPVLVQGSGFCIPITAATFFLFRVPVRLLTHSRIKETTLSQIFLGDKFSWTLLTTFKPVLPTFFTICFLQL